MTESRGRKQKEKKIIKHEVRSLLRGILVILTKKKKETLGIACLSPVHKGRGKVDIAVIVDIFLKIYALLGTPQSIPD